MKKLVIASVFILLSCEKENRFTNYQFKEDQTIVDFVAYRMDTIGYHMDTLKSNILNKIKFEYSNTQFEKYPDKRYLDVYYTIQDSFYNGDIDDIENYKYGVLSNAKKTDTLSIDTFGEKGNKIVTFIVYDEILLPVHKDSANIKNVIGKYGFEVFIK